ncbi:MAG: phosphodiester glycosidase family protein [Muribaculaceae bacterium]|nr:phosphodiester glycosidase family protein [Muribaculaceae bacterium]
MKIKFFLLFLISILQLSALASDNDSITFVNAEWTVTTSPEGLTFHTAEMNLFDSNQSVSYVIFPYESFDITLVPHDGLKKVSETATENNALCAINAGYWNMDTDIAATYIRSNGKDLSKTESVEGYRVNGIVIFDSGNFSIEYCDTTQYGDVAARFDNILSCGPLLIDEDFVFDYTGRGGFFSNRHPRSVIGTTPDGEMIFLVVDGRNKGQADGVSIPELTEICQWLGMKDALNLDGGGSSTLWFEGAVVNHPSDNHRYDHEGERKVSSSIIVGKNN